MMPDADLLDPPAITCKRIANHATTQKSAASKSAAAEPQYLIRMKSARSTEFPLKRLAVRSCFPPTVFVILTNQKCQSYQLSGKTPSNMTCSAGNELRVSMDGADDLSALSIPGPGCVTRQSSCYGRCFARSVEPDAALRLARRKTRDMPPSSAVCIRHAFRRDLQSAETQICKANPTGLRHKDSMLSSSTERSELTPSRLFPSARRNRSREAAADNYLPADCESCRSAEVNRDGRSGSVGGCMAAGG